MHSPPAVLASQVQVTPTWLVSDGTAFFWTTNGTPALLAMPVGGGAISILLEGPITGNSQPFLAVDDLNVYLLDNYSLIRIPKNGTQATLISDPGSEVYTASALGSTIYWGESVPSGVALNSAPLKGGPTTLIAQFSPSTSGGGGAIGVTTSTVFLGPPPLHYFPTTGMPASGFQTVGGGETCNSLMSDTDAIYCSQSSGSNFRIASDGSDTILGPAASSSYIVFDDTFAYWVDEATVGTIMMAPKAGGGTATVLARDTSPTTIAVDAHSVYWSDVAGYIKSVPK